MDTEQVSLFLALLSFLALGIGISSLGLLVTGRAEQLRSVAELLLPLAFAIALVSTLGSLYYSGIAQFRPCRFCWWQRIMMYPLVPVLGIGVIRKDAMAALYGLPLAIGGLGYATWHTQLRWFPDQGSSCEIDAACASVWVNTFDFVSIPFMAGSGFIAILGLLSTLLWLQRTSPSQVDIPTNEEQLV